MKYHASCLRMKLNESPSRTAAILGSNVSYPNSLEVWASRYWIDMVNKILVSQQLLTDIKL